MLTREDLTELKNSEGYLGAARRRRAGTSRNGGIASTGETVWGTVSTDTGDVRGYESEGPGTSQSVYGGDGSEESGTGNMAQFSEQFRRNGIKSPRRGNSVYQSERPDGKSFWSSVKGTAKLYSDALKTQPKKKSSGTSKKVEGRKLTDAEVIKMRPKLIQLIVWQSEHLDEFISATTRGHAPVEIWSTLDYDDAEILADYLISRARVDERAAVAVRYAATIMDKIKLGIIVGPRLYQTMLTYFDRGFSIGPIFQRRY